MIRRWHQHLKGTGAKYFRAHTPEMLVFVEEQPDRSAACRREYEIKQFSKQKKEAMIQKKDFSN